MESLPQAMALPKGQNYVHHATYRFVEDAATLRRVVQRLEMMNVSGRSIYGDAVEFTGYLDGILTAVYVGITYRPTDYGKAGKTGKISPVEQGEVGIGESALAWDSAQEQWAMAQRVGLAEPAPELYFDAAWGGYRYRQQQPDLAGVVTSDNHQQFRIVADSYATLVGRVA